MDEAEARALHESCEGPHGAQQAHPRPLRFGEDDEGTDGKGPVFEVVQILEERKGEVLALGFREEEGDGEEGHGEEVHHEEVDRQEIHLEGFADGESQLVFRG